MITFRAVWLALATVCFGSTWFALRAQDDRPWLSYADAQRLFEWDFPAMGTSMTLQAYSSDAATVAIAFSETKAEIDRLASILTDYEEESETVRLTQSSQVGLVQMVSPELWDVLEACDHFWELSEGKFDASIGPLSQLWRKARRSKRVPTHSEIEQARSLVGWSHIKRDVHSKTVTVQSDGVRLDFGGIAKGWIVDRAYGILAEHGLEHCLVRAGGDIRCGAAPPGKAGWTILIGPLAGEKVFLKSLILHDEAVATSGDLWQYQLVDGVRRSHIIDPQTGYGVAGPISATVRAPNATDADALASILCLMGPERGCLLVEQLPHIEAMVTRSLPDENIEYTSTSKFTRKN